MRTHEATNEYETKPMAPVPSEAAPNEAGASGSGEPKELVATAAIQTSAPPPVERKLRGFAAMDRAAVRAIARRGGVAAHERGTAHRFTATEAQEAGRKGGLAPHKTRGGPSRARSKAPQPEAPTGDGAGKAR